MPGNKIDYWGAYIRSFHCVSHALRRCRVTKLMPWECPHSTFPLRSTRFENMPENKFDYPGVATFNVSVVFYMLCEEAGQQRWFPGSAHLQQFYCVLHALRECQITKMIPCECPHSQFLLRFTRFEKMLGKQIASLGAPTGNNCLVITIKCGLESLKWGSALSFGFRPHWNALTKAHSQVAQLQMSAGYIILYYIHAHVCL